VGNMKKRVEFPGNGTVPTHPLQPCRSYVLLLIVIPTGFGPSGGICGCSWDASSGELCNGSYVPLDTDPKILSAQ
jgi:hypothetical protein